MTVYSGGLENYLIAGRYECGEGMLYFGVALFPKLFSEPIATLMAVGVMALVIALLVYGCKVLVGVLAGRTWGTVVIHWMKRNAGLVVLSVFLLAALAFARHCKMWFF